MRAASASSFPLCALFRLDGDLPVISPPPLPTHHCRCRRLFFPPPPSATIAVAPLAAATAMADRLPDRMGSFMTSAGSPAAAGAATTRPKALLELECVPSCVSSDMEHSNVPEPVSRTGSTPLHPTIARTKKQVGALRHLLIPSDRPRRTRSLLARLVSEDLAHETDVYEGVPLSCSPEEVRKRSSLRSASRVLGGADPESSTDDEMDELDVIRRRSIDVSSLERPPATPVTDGPRSRPTTGVCAVTHAPPSPRGVVPSLFVRTCHPVAKGFTATAASTAPAGSPNGGPALVRVLSSDQATGEGLLEACAKGRQATVRKLLRAGVSPASSDEQGRSALAYAAAGGHMAVVEHLVRHAGAAAATLRDVKGQTPVDEAFKAGHMKVARFLEDEVRVAGH